MKKIFIIPILLLFTLLVNSKTASAKVSCPHSEMSCTEIDSQGGCEDPCIRVVTTQGGPGGRGGTVTAKCECQIPKEECAREGEFCQGAANCCSSAPYCWGEFHQTPVCHKISRAEELDERQPGTVSAPDSDIELFCPEGGLNTAIGCIPISDTGALIGFILGWAIGIGGGIAFLLILFAGFQIMTSSGNPDRLKAGQELMTSAITGLILLIFSVFILKIIGVDILGLPEFGQ